MRSSWFGKLVFVAALAVMPLQGVAAVMVAFVCHGDAQAQAMHAGDGHDHGAPHDSRHDDGGSTDTGSHHPCCQYSVFAPAAETPPAAQPDQSLRLFSPDTPRELFVPEQPQRPPLA